MKTSKMCKIGTLKISKMCKIAVLKISKMCKLGVNEGLMVENIVVH